MKFLISTTNSFQLELEKNNFDDILELHPSIELLYTWEYEEDYDIEVWGKKTGEPEEINRTDLPQPVDTDIFYGPLILTCKKNDRHEDFGVEDFHEFLEVEFEGFEELGSDGDSFEQDEEYEYDDFCIEE